MPGGGKLTIDTRNVVADEAYTSSRPGLKRGRFVRLAVSDTGSGMTPEGRFSWSKTNRASGSGRTGS
jgi:two-component system, cell cycle sensor histidine kinase and response regulator CckA